MANGIKLGNLDISAFKVGSSDCKVYLGDTLLYPQSSPGLPTGYTQVEYVEATGQSSVNLDIQLYATVGNAFEISTHNEMINDYTWGQYQTFLTCMSEAGNPYPGFSNRFSMGSVECYFSPNSGEHQYSRTLVSGDVYTTVVSCSGVPAGYTHNYPLVLFSSLDGSQSPFRYCKGKIYNMTVTLNDNLVRNLVPCVKDDQNIAGLYDLVGGVFYSSSTSSQLAAPSLIPTAYTQVEYVENTGTTYINTGFKPNQNTKIILTTQCVTSTSGGRQIGAGGYDGVNAIQFDYENGATGTLHISWGGYSRWSVYNNCVGDYNKHTYEWDGNTFYRDKGTQDEFSATTSYTTYQCTDDLAIFTRLQNGAGGGSTEAFKGKVFDFKLYDDGTLVRDLIPCYRNSDNKAGMYDIVNDVFYYPPNGNLVIPTASITYSVTLTGLENGDTIDYINWNNGDSYEFSPGNGTYTYTTKATSINVNIMYDSSSYSANTNNVPLDENDTSYTFVLTPTGGGGPTQIPYGADMTQYYGRVFSRFVINDTSLPSGYGQISLGFNTGGNGNIASWSTNFTVGSTNVSSLPCDVTDTDIITSWTTYDSSWQTTNLNPFQDLQIEFI